VQPDRFTGGLRLNVTQVWDLAAARARFGRYLSVQVDGSIAPLAEVLKAWPARRAQTEHGESVHGLGVRVKVRAERVVETGVHHYPRLHGRSQFFRIRSLFTTFSQLLDLYTRVTFRNVRHLSPGHSVERVP